MDKKNNTKKKPQSLADINKMNPLTKKILIASLSLIAVAFVVLCGVTAYQRNQEAASDPQKASQTVKGRIAALASAYYPSESEMIEAINKNSKNFEAFAVYEIGTDADISDPESSLYKLEPISGANKARVNYFKMEDGTYLRSVFNVSNDLIIGNFQIKESALNTWMKFDKAQQELGKRITSDDQKIDLSMYSELESMMENNTYLKN